MYRTFTQDKSLRRALLLVGVLTWMVLGASDSVGAQTYSFTRIDVPGAFHTAVWGINNAGQIVGAGGFPNTLRGFVYTEGSFSTIDVPGSISTSAYGINDAGQIVGNFIDATGQHGFIATPIVTPPVSTITATPDTLWPPNGKLVPVTVSGTITDKDSNVDAITATYEVTDEYGLIQPSGEVTLDANGNYAFTIPLQASRNGNDADGRQYTITVRAVDDEDNGGSADAIVTVPHDLGQGRSSAAR